MRKCAAVVVLVVVGFLLIKACLNDSASENVVEKVKKNHENASWMKHVTDWRTSLGFTVETDYESTKLGSYAHAYEICETVKSEYDKDATDFPNLRIYGLDTTRHIMIDGSHEDEADKVILAESTSAHRYACGITPPKDLLKAAVSLKVPVRTQR